MELKKSERNFKMPSHSPKHIKKSVDLLKKNPVRYSPKAVKLNTSGKKIRIGSNSPRLGDSAKILKTSGSGKNILSNNVHVLLLI